VCKDCKRSFARQDSLIRHERLHTRQDCARYASPPSNVAAGSVSSQSLQNVGARNCIGNALASARTQDQALPERQSATAAGLQHVTPPAELDLELIWPDSEDLFQTIMSSDDTNQWQIPLGTSLFPPESCPPSNTSFGSPSSFDDRAPSIGAIPSGGNHQAMHDVSNLISSLVSLAIRS
jgi:uncharacterized Zn-finger protein